MNEKEKFTPGPWEVRDKMYGDIRIIQVTSDLPPYFIAGVTHGFSQKIMTSNHLEINWEELRANADLLAASPEMYEFIKSLTSFGGQILLATLGEDGMNIYNEALRVLAKARGEVAP